MNEWLTCVFDVLGILAVFLGALNRTIQNEMRDSLDRGINHEKPPSIIIEGLYNIHVRKLDDK